MSAQVVVGVDGSKGSDAAVRWAAGYAVHRGRELRLMHGLGLVGVNTVAGAYAVTAQDVIDAARAQGRNVITHAEHLAQLAAPEVRLSSAMTSDSPAGLLVEHSAEAFAVVIGATGSAGTLAHLGSTLLAVTAHAHGTVIVVPAEHADRANAPVVVGVDGSPVSERAIAAAFIEAAERRTSLVAVHACADWDIGHFAGTDPFLGDAASEEAEKALLAERLAGWQEKYPDVPVVRKIYMSAPAERLREWSQTAQLVVVGSRGRGGISGLLLGSTSNFLVQHAQCPVMVVHPATR
ncbi:universal stress protein [Nocardia alni]|uniref:universal stress protein n=1 Tax=Nocardia alni TaxID=2815723 RepID=UPI0027E08A1B|nr:universal stress protein [Nocardia alni]